MRIEVKSSSTEIRTHHFSSSQLNPINNTEIIIASILVNINAGGFSLEEILGRINNKLNDYPKQKEKLHFLVFSVLGTDIDKINEVKFDYQLTQESLRFFNSIDIPKIKNNDIPKEVTNVRFISNLINPKSIDIQIDELIKPHIADK